MSASEFYSSLEEKWYNFCDSLQEKGVRVYDWFVNPVEDRGLPSLPIAVAAVLLLLLVTSFALFGLAGGTQESTQTFSVSVLSNTGEKIDGAIVRIYTEDGTFITKETTRKGRISLDLEPGKSYAFTVTKDGFETIKEQVVRADGKIELKLKEAEKEAKTKTDEEELNDLWFEDDYASESTTGELSIYVGDEDYLPVPGIASIYNANTDVLIEKLRIEDESIVPDLELDSILYVNFEPDDSIKYKKVLNGAESPITIDSGFNQHTIYVEKKVAGEGQEFPTTISILDEDGAWISNVLVRVYPINSNVPLSTSKLTDKNGEVTFDLETDNTYYATAYSNEHLFAVSDSFQAGDKPLIHVTTANEDNSADLYLALIDEEDYSPIVEGDVAIFFKQGEAAFQIGETHSTDSDGLTVFAALERGSNIILRAAKGSRFVEATLLISSTDKEIAVELELPLNKATLSLSAEDWMSGVTIPALFTTYYNGEFEDSCTSSDSPCEIEVKARREITIVAEASDYVEMVRTETLIADETREITMKLYDEDSLEGSAVDFLGFYNSLDQPVQTLMLGHEYEAQFSFVASNNAQLSGLFLQFHNDSYAGIIGVYPPAAITYANTENSDNIIDAECSPEKPCNWMDVQYAGSKAGDITYLIRVDDDVPLNDDRVAYLEWGYRSYIAQDEYTLLRNPFDAELGTDVSEPLPSGFNAEQHRQGIYVLSPGTSCQNGYCISTQFVQGENVRNEGFEALSMVNIGEQDVAYASLHVRFQVETYKELGDETYLSIEYDPTHLRFDKTVLNAQLSGEPPYICGSTPTTIFDEDSAVEVEWVESSVGTNLKRLTFDVSGLVDCTNYANPERILQPFVFDGYSEFKPLASTDYTEYYTQVTTFNGEARAGRHGSWLKVINNDGAYSEYASVESSFEQRNNEFNPENNPWKVYYNGDCNVTEFSDESCDYGLVKINLAFTSARRRNENKIVLETIPTHLKIIAASYYRDGEQTPLHVSESGFHTSVGAMEEGETITAIAYAMATGRDEYSQITARHIAVDGDGEHGTNLKRDVFVAFKPDAETTYEDVNVENATYNYFDAQKDSCRGRLHLTFDEEATDGKQLRLGDNCYSVAMRVSPIYPVDAIPVKISGDANNILYSIVEDDGSSNCYESCDSDGSGCTSGFNAFTSEGEQVLRYNTESPNCPEKFKTIGNRIRDSSIEIEFGTPGGEKATLQIVVENYENLKSVYLGPIYRSYNEEVSFSGEGGRGESEFTEAKYHPQLWAITNHKQTGERHFIIVETDTAEDPERFQALNPYFRIDFDGPGTQTFAYYPHPSKRMVVFEELSNAKPIFVYDSCFESWNGDGFDQMPWNSEHVETECAARGDPYWDAIVDINEEYGITLWPEYVEAEYDVENSIQDFVCSPDLPPQEQAACESYREGLQGWLDEGINTKYDGNLGYSPAGQLRMFNRAREVANATAFWRSNKLAYYCASDDAVKALNKNVPENLKHKLNDFSDWDVCRPTIDDWRNMSEDFIVTKTPCTVCNNTYNPNCNEDNEIYLPCTYNEGIPVFDCTQQCFAYNFEGELIGSAWVEYATEFIDDYNICITDIGSTNYDGSTPLNKITQTQINSCLQGNCPLDLINENEATCIVDADGDGFRTYETPQPAEPFQNEYRCTNGIISIRKQYCLREGTGKECRLDGYSGNGLTSITPSEVTACFTSQDDGEHYCPLEVDGEQKPYCFKDYNNDGLFQGDEDVDEYGQQVIQPSVLEDGEYKCTEQGLQIIVNKYCNAPCTNYCLPRDSATECDITCGKDGYKWDMEYGFKNQTFWDGALGALQEETGDSFDAGQELTEIHAEYASDSQNYSQHTLLPARWFPEYGTEFNYHFPVNSFGKTNSFYGEPDWPEAMRVSTVGGCTVEEDAKYAATSEWGIYDLQAKNLPDIATGDALWTGHATALNLQKERYLGVQCRKPTDVFGDVPLCAPVYSDYSNTYGSCINSLYLLGDDAIARLGDNFTNFMGRTNEGSFDSEGCILTPAGFLLCLDEDEVDAMDDITGVYGWKQKYSMWTPAGEKKEGEWKWQKGLGTEILAWGSTLLGAGSLVDSIGGSIPGVGGDMKGPLGMLGGMSNVFGMFGGGSSSPFGALLRGAIQGGLQAGALSAGYSECTWKIITSSATQGAASFLGQGFRNLGSDTGDFMEGSPKAKVERVPCGGKNNIRCPDNLICEGQWCVSKTAEEDDSSFWSDAATIGGTMIDAGGWAAIRFGYYSRAPGEEDWGCSRYECFHNDANVIERPDEVTQAVAADYSLVGGCRGPSINKWEVRAK